MRRQKNLITLFCAMFAFFFGCFLTSTLTNIENKCLTQSPSLIKENHEVFLIILIISAPSNFEKRQAIRDTWLKLSKKPLALPYYPEDFLFLPNYEEDGKLFIETVEQQHNRLRLFEDWKSNLNGKQSERRNFNVKSFFVVGTNNLKASQLRDLDQEQSKNEDLLLIKDLHDSYKNLTKKLLMSFELLMNNFSFDYLLKVDDDTYVKIDFLLNDLVSYDRKLIRRSSEYKDNLLPELYWGYFSGSASIKTNGQWKETRYNLCKNYLPYALGGGYVLSRKIIEFLNKNSRLLNTYVSEDVSVGTWLSNLNFIYRNHDTRFDTGWMPRACQTYHIVLHKRSIENMKDLYEGKLCGDQYEKTKFMKRPLQYYYNWNTSPDKCCISYE